MLPNNKFSTYIKLISGGAILAFGLYNIHEVANITEGGVLGLTLLLDYWFNISPAISNFILNLLCYFLGFKALGKKFIWYSLVSSAGTSIFYGIYEQFPPVWPGIVDHPLIASVLGACFVGVGVGLAMSAGGAPGGDDALSLAINRFTNIPIQKIYLFNDLIVLIFSLSYIPLIDIIYSLITVTLSGHIIGLITNKQISDISSE